MALQNAPNMVRMGSPEGRAGLWLRGRGKSVPRSPPRYKNQCPCTAERPVRLSGTVYCHKAGLAALDVLRHRWMVAGWTLKVLATSLMDRPSSTRERARVF